MQWHRIEDKEPPSGEDVLVVKHYLDQNFCMETGGYVGPYFRTSSHMTIDRCFISGLLKIKRWGKGGVVTHWMPLPKMPEKPNE